jgi:hypothetical protein
VALDVRGENNGLSHWGHPMCIEAKLTSESLQTRGLGHQVKLSSGLIQDGQSLVQVQLQIQKIQKEKAQSMQSVCLGLSLCVFLHVGVKRDGQRVETEG